MTPQQIVGLALRLFAIWMLVVAIQMTGAVFVMSAQFEGGSALALFAIPAFIVLLAILLWNFPMTAAHRLVPRTDALNTLGMPAREATAAAAAIIGIYAVVSAFPHIVAPLAMAVISGAREFRESYFTEERYVQMLTDVALLGLGLFLTFKARFVAGMIFPARSQAALESDAI